MKRRNDLLVLAVLLAFTLLTAVRHLSSPGADLFSSYGSCRLLAEHRPDHLYSRDLRNYDAVGDPEWDRLAKATGFPSEKLIHPYVQTPLWAYSLQPLCTRMNFPAFNIIFLCALSLCLSATIWFVARTWAPRAFHPGWIALVCAALYLSEAYKYSMALTQTHILFILLTLIALACGQRKHFIWAGALLAAAAAVKITPALLVLYWLVVRQWRSALSFAAFSLLFAAASVLTTGWALNLTYLHNLSQVSNMLLVSWNNQSLAALWMAPHYPASELQLWHDLPLPQAVKLTSVLLSILCTLAGGYLDRRAIPPGSVQPPYGAAIAMLGATMFAPLAWTHYYVVLIFPLLLLLAAIIEKRSLLIAAIVFIVFALNFDTQTLGGVLQHFRLFPIVRAQFFSGLVCIAGLAVVTLARRPLFQNRAGAGVALAHTESPRPL